MSQKYSVNEILKAVDSINPYKPSSKKFAKEEILDAVTELYNSQNQKQTQNINHAELQSNILPITNKLIAKPKLEKKEKFFTKPLLLTNIIKYEPVKSKALFLKKLHNSNLKIIAMKVMEVKKIK